MIVTNVGNMFQEEALHELTDRLELDDAILRQRFDLLRDYYERRKSMMNEEMSVDETAFFFVNRALHILGYTQSHNEPLAQSTFPHRPDYTLFANASDFLDREPSRGTAQFYTLALGIVKIEPWDRSMDPENEDEVSPDHPAFILDGLLRQTGLQWGILTNGTIWRIYHRSTSGLLTTYYEVDLKEILETNDFDAFRYFAGVFSVEALLPDDMGMTVIQQILN